MYDAIECLKGLSQIITAYDISVQDALKAGEMIGALNTIINDLRAEVLKLSESAWEMRTVDELSKPAKNWR